MPLPLKVVSSSPPPDGVSRSSSASSRGRPRRGGLGRRVEGGREPVTRTEPSQSKSHMVRLLVIEAGLRNREGATGAQAGRLGRGVPTSVPHERRLSAQIIY